MSKKKVRVSPLVVLLGAGLTTGLLIACGGSQTPAEAPKDDEHSPGASAEPSEEAKSFDDMSAPERMQFMKKVVAPEMAQVFKEYDAEHYADFGCGTCHGPGAREGNFEMPTDSLPRLDQEEMAEHPEMTKFMAEHVVPRMAKLLGEEPYNPETHEGFGCFDCHMKKE